MNNTSCMFLLNFEFTTKAFNHLLIKPLYCIYIRIYGFLNFDFSPRQHSTLSSGHCCMFLTFVFSFVYTLLLKRKGFENEASGEDLRIFDSYTSLIHAIEAYLLTITGLFSIMSTFEIFHPPKFGMEKYVIPNFELAQSS